MNIIILFVLLSTNTFGKNRNSFIIDYTKANINTQKYSQVPKGVLLWLKTAALEPLNIYQGQLRGHGWAEPLDNLAVLALRKEKIPVYVDYFTNAKRNFYFNNPGYITCGARVKTWKNYQKSYNDLKQNDFKFNNKFELWANPNHMYSAISIIGIGAKKRHLFSKHLWKNTNVYNIKSILDDPELYTTQITGQASSLSQYIYVDPPRNYTIFPQYKKRVYDFVASNAIQITLMLNAGRMDYADMLFTGDFHVKKLKISEKNILLAKQSHVHPDTFTKDDLLLDFNICRGDNLSDLQKYIKIINESQKKIRGDILFWNAVLKQYSIDMDLPYVSPKDFDFTKEAIKYKKELDAGEFDLQ